MHYDPIKRSLGGIFNRTPLLRILFYKMLDLLLLRSWHIHKELKKWAPSDPNNVHVLDAGSGFGQYTYHISSKHRNWNLLSVDVKQEQVCDCNNFFRAINHKNVLFKTEDLTQFSQPESFDLAISIDVMEHILEDVMVFKNIHKSLKPGGMLLISTPSDQGGSDVHEEEEGSFIDEHVRDGYNINEIEEKLKMSGFSKVEANYSYGTPGKISWKLSMKYPMTALNISKLFFVLLPAYYLITFPFCVVLNYLDTIGKHPTGTGLIVKAWK